MPSYYPEADVPQPDDNEYRLLQKWCSLLYIANGNMGPSYYPEGSRPLPDDSEERLLEKINALRS